MGYFGVFAFTSKRKQLFILQNLIGHEVAVRRGPRPAGQAMHLGFDPGFLLAQGLQQPRPRGMVGVRVGTHNGANICACGHQQPLNVLGIAGPGINGDKTGGRFTDQVAVGARAGHHALIRCGQAQHVFAQRHHLRRLPVQHMLRLPIGAEQGQFAIGRFVFHAAVFLAAQTARTRHAAPQRARLHGRQQRCRLGVGRQALQGAQGGINHGHVPIRMLLQRLLGRDPDRLELFALIGHGHLPLRGQSNEKGHRKAFGHARVRRPMGQQPHPAQVQLQAPGQQLGPQGSTAVQGIHIGLGGRAAIGMHGQQQAHLFKRFAHRGNGRLALGRRHGRAGQHGQALLRILRLQPTAGEHVAARHKAGLGRAARHQQLPPLGGGAAHQKQGGGIQQRRWRAGRVNIVLGSHGRIICPTQAQKLPGQSPVLQPSVKM